MSKRSIPGLLGTLLLCLQPAVVHSSPIQVASFTFSEDAFADAVFGFSGAVSFNGTTLESTITGHDLSTSMRLPTEPRTGIPLFVEIGFLDNLILNGPGADLIVFEEARPESIVASPFVGGVEVFIPVTSTGFFTDRGTGLNAGLIDLSDLGFAPGESTNRIVLSNAAVGSGADLLAVGALNSVSVTVPEPSTLLLLATGLATVAYRRRKG